MFIWPSQTYKSSIHITCIPFAWGVNLMKAFSPLLALCVGNLPVRFPTQRASNTGVNILVNNMRTKTIDELVKLDAITCTGSQRVISASWGRVHTHSCDQDHHIDGQPLLIGYWPGCTYTKTQVSTACSLGAGRLGSCWVEVDGVPLGIHHRMAQKGEELYGRLVAYHGSVQCQKVSSS